jgi:hypothetical protein
MITYTIRVLIEVEKGRERERERERGYTTLLLKAFGYKEPRDVGLSRNDPITCLDEVDERRDDFLSDLSS